MPPTRSMRGRTRPETTSCSAAGAFAPGTRAGFHLLAHEVAHVVQQRARTVPSGISRPGDAFELEAERLAAAAEAPALVDDDVPANAAARAIDAGAYTLGNHIVFRAGKYMPQTDTGRRPSETVQRQVAGGAATSKPDPLAEAHRESLAAVANIEANWQDIRSGGAKAFGV